MLRQSLYPHYDKETKTTTIQTNGRTFSKPLFFLGFDGLKTDTTAENSTSAFNDHCNVSMRSRSEKELKIVCYRVSVIVYLALV